MPDPHAEFQADIAARVGTAALGLLRDDTDLAAYFGEGDGIRDFESEQIAIDAGSLKPPGLGVSLGPLSERRTGNDNYAQMGIAVDLWMFTPIDLRWGTEGWLRARLVDAIKKVLLAGSGVLYDAIGNPITEAYCEFDRIDFRGRLRDKKVLVTPMRLTVFSDFNQVSREPL
jgi:hypothetical protein